MPSPRVSESDKRYQEIKEKFSRMSLGEKITELDVLRKKRKTLEREVRDISGQIATLENMPDVAEYRIQHDKIAMDFVEELRQSGDTTYKKLAEPFATSEAPILFHYVTLLKTAGLITLKADPKDVGNETINLTARGRQIKYVEPTKQK